MKQLIPFALAATMFTPAAHAEEAPGLSLMERGAQMFLEGILKEMEPAVEDLQDLADDMGPKLSELLDEVEDWSVYMPPEVLPNGDIIIRRKPDHPMTPPDAPTEPAPQIDL
ncbi:hypothetical protein [Sulfitobacter geojensis]|uniref:hypothetical protein n=1 Tax=Sulfitobacter geojensis TaxID=1342299 RepID=UPI0004693A72|nr:hypothetical protein [Sulfitobacter geojensis]KHA53019.1 hypothetical protein Z947_3330 [Sulfitobacter geojensis]NYI28328.1 hypothetical protein [Sulfitobacter geojensis]